MTTVIKTILAFLFAALLLYLGFHYFLSDEQKKMIFAIPFTVHAISFLLVIPCYLIGGIELRLLYSRVSKIKLSAYDTATLPFVINLWGFIIPFQGSFFYMLAYILSKYKKGITESIRVYLISFSVAMSIAGFAGGLYYFVTDYKFPLLFFILCCLLFINPFLLYLTGRLSSMYNGKSKWMKPFAEKLSEVVSSESIDRQLIFFLAGIKIINVILTSLWCWWIVANLHLQLSFMQLILISLLMNIMALVKITPGNLGLSQFASGGIALLVGGTMNDGFLLSSFQYLTIIIAAVILGGIFSFFNMKYFSWQAFKSMMAKKETMT